MKHADSGGHLQHVLGLTVRTASLETYVANALKLTIVHVVLLVLTYAFSQSHFSGDVLGEA